MKTTSSASILLDEEWVRVSELLLGSGGPLFTANGRRHIEELSETEQDANEIPSFDIGFLWERLGLARE